MGGKSKYRRLFTPDLQLRLAPDCGAISTSSSTCFSKDSLSCAGKGWSCSVSSWRRRLVPFSPISPARVDTLSQELLRPCEPTRFDIPHWGLAKEAFVLAIELTRALIPDFERCAGCIEPLDQHSLARGN